MIVQICMLLFLSLFFVSLFVCFVVFQQFCWCYCSAHVVDLCTGILEVIIFIFPNDQLKEFGVLTVNTCLLLYFVVLL